MRDSEKGKEMKVSVSLMINLSENMYVLFLRVILSSSVLKSVAVIRSSWIFVFSLGGKEYISDMESAVL